MFRGPLRGEDTHVGHTSGDGARLTLATQSCALSHLGPRRAALGVLGREAGRVKDRLPAQLGVRGRAAEDYVRARGPRHVQPPVLQVSAGKRHDKRRRRRRRRRRRDKDDHNSDDDGAAAVERMVRTGPVRRERKALLRDVRGRISTLNDQSRGESASDAQL